MKKCLLCGSVIEPFMSFGKMPVANGFLTAKEFNDEPFYDLAVGFCSKCTMVQLVDQVDQKRLFHEEYPFVSSSSARMVQHFRRLAKSVVDEYLEGKAPFVVEIGSNDGVTLQNFAKNGIRHLGVEPSSNVAEIAQGKGINTIIRFFDVKVANEIVAEYGKADVCLATNVVCHIPDLNGFAAAVKALLKRDGVLIFEDPYLGDIVTKTAYDQMYDEHVFYFSVTSISKALEHCGLQLIDVHPQVVHGGSMRYFVSHKGARPVRQSVKAQCHTETRLGLDYIDTYHKFRKRVERSRDDLVAILHDLKRKAKRVIGYGATSKSTTVTNYCGISSSLVEFISDTTPVKQGKYSPGMHIPIRPYEDFATHYPDVALLFAWNHAEEIMAKEQGFRVAQGKWLVYVPNVMVLE